MARAVWTGSPRSSPRGSWNRRTVAVGAFTSPDWEVSAKATRVFPTPRSGVAKMAWSPSSEIGPFMRGISSGAAAGAGIWGVGSGAGAWAQARVAASAAVVSRA